MIVLTPCGKAKVLLNHSLGLTKNVEADVSLSVLLDTDKLILRGSDGF
jgi:hypothetical protein